MNTSKPEIHPPRKSPRQRIVVRVLAAVLSLSAITVVPWLYYVGQGKRAVEAELGALRDAGYMVTLEEVNARYHDPSLNPEENAAPLYREAFSQMEPKGYTESTIQIRRDLLELEPGRQLAWESQAQVLNERLEQNAVALGLLREAAQKPYARFDILFPWGHDLVVQHPHRMVQGVRLLVLATMARAANGTLNSEIGDLDDALAIAAHLIAEPMLVSQHARIDMIRLVCETVEWLVDRHLLEGTDMALLNSLLLWHEVNLGMPLGIETEFVYWMPVFPKPSLEFAEAIFRGDDFALSVAFHVLSGTVYRDHSFYLRAVGQQLEVLRDPVEDWLPHYERDWSALAEVNDHWLSAKFMTDSRRYREAEVYSVALLRITRILLALERYRMEEGHLPEDLGELAPRFLETIPVDPVAGGPFTVRYEDEWVVLESAGQVQQGPDREQGPIHGKIRR